MEIKAKTKSGSQGKPCIDLNIFEDQVKKYFAGKLQEREIVGSFNSIDLESQGFFEKNNFLYCITSYINKLLSNE